MPDMDKLPDVGHELRTDDGRVFIVEQMTFSAEHVTIKLQDKRAAILRSTIDLATLERLWDIALKIHNAEIERQIQSP